MGKCSTVRLHLNPHQQSWFDWVTLVPSMTQNMPTTDAIFTGFTVSVYTNSMQVVEALVVQ